MSYEPSKRHSLSDNMKVISVMSANSLYWLGRYEERVYMMLHLMRKSYDTMIDESESPAERFSRKIGIKGGFRTNDEFIRSVVFDELNPSSVISAQKNAHGNAMLLRECIFSETLSYLEMSLALLHQQAERQDYSLAVLQPVTDYALAFWGSAEQRIFNLKIVDLMSLGRYVENLDMLLRFDYEPYRLAAAFRPLQVVCRTLPEAINANAYTQLKQLLGNEAEAVDSDTQRQKVLALVNGLSKFC